MTRRAWGTASLAVLAILVAGPAFGDTVIGGGDPPGPVPVPVPQLPATPPPPAPVPDPAPVVNEVQQAATTTGQQATDTANQVVNAVTTASRTQGPATTAPSDPSDPSAPAAAPRLTRHAPKPVASHRQPASRHTLRAVHRGPASAPVATTTQHRAVRHRAAARRHPVFRRRAGVRPVPALPVLTAAPPRQVASYTRPSAHHGGIHHSLAMPVPLSKTGMLIGLGLLGALALLGLRFFAVDVLPGMRAGIAARRHPW